MADISTGQPDLGKVKATIHRRLIQRLNLDRVTQLNRDAVRAEVVQLVDSMTNAESAPMTLQEKERLPLEFPDEFFGLGPFNPLLKNPPTSNILVNTHKVFYI